MACVRAQPMVVQVLRHVDDVVALLDKDKSRPPLPSASAVVERPRCVTYCEIGVSLLSVMFGLDGTRSTANAVRWTSRSLARSDSH